MRRFIRPATAEEEKLVTPHIAEGEMLLGVHKDQNMYAVRQPDGALRYIDFATVNPPTVTQRIAHFFGR